jgi:hypothetical protein
MERFQFVGANLQSAEMLLTHPTPCLHRPLEMLPENAMPDVACPNLFRFGILPNKYPPAHEPSRSFFKPFMRWTLA